MKASLSSLGTKGSEYDLIWVRGFQPGNRRTKREGRIFIDGSRESFMAEWKRFFAKVAKSFENQCETEGARSHQSLWKPFRFWFVSLNFGKEVLALQSVTSWCQNYHHGLSHASAWQPASPPASHNNYYYYDNDNSNCNL